MKLKKIGGMNMTEDAYEKFVSLPKQEQLEKVYNSLNPKDMVSAEKLLKNVPNGDNGSGTKAEAGENKTERPTGGGKGNN